MSILIWWCNFQSLLNLYDYKIYIQRKWLRWCCAPVRLMTATQVRLNEVCSKIFFVMLGAFFSRNDCKIWKDSLSNNLNLSGYVKGSYVLKRNSLSYRQTTVKFSTVYFALISINFAFLIIKITYSVVTCCHVSIRDCAQKEKKREKRPSSIFIWK